MVENGEKRILGFFCPVKELDIVNDQYIYHLVKMDEIIDRIIPTVVYKLVDEFFRTDV